MHALSTVIKKTKGMHWHLTILVVGSTTHPIGFFKKRYANVDIDLVVITAPRNGILSTTSQLTAYVFAQKVTLVCRTRTYSIYRELNSRQYLTPKTETFWMHLYARTPLYSSSYKNCTLLFISKAWCWWKFGFELWTLNMDDNILHVALGQNVKEYKSILLWALQNSGGKTISVIHVHQPANMIPISKLPTSLLLYMCVRTCNVCA